MKNLVEPIKSKIGIQTIEGYLYKHSKRNHLIWILGVKLGLCVTEILKLNVEDVKNKNYIEVENRNTETYKILPLSKDLQKIIKNYLENSRKHVHAIGDDEPLFVGRKHKRLDRSQVYRFLKDACRNLDINVNVGTRTMKKTYCYFNS